MAKQVSWLSIDSRMPHDPKLANLPDNDYRWAWPCLLCLEKRGELEGQDVSGFAHYCHIEQNKFNQILNDLHGSGLLDDEFRPRGFEAWQKRVQSGERVRRHREKQSSCNANVTQGNGKKRNSTQMTPSETDTETDTKTDKKDSSCPNSGELVAARGSVFNDDIKRLGRVLAQRILDNDPKARIPNNNKTRGNWLAAIEKLNRIDGRSLAEIEAVINWCQDDDFWKANILSASKLRKQFPQLLAKMNSNGSKRLAGPDLIAYNRKIIDELNNELET